MDIGSYACGVATVLIVEFAMLVALVWKEYSSGKRKNDK